MTEAWYDLSELDLSDPDTYSRYDQHQIWRQLRSEGGIHRQPGTADKPSFWVVTKYNDVKAVLGDTERFTSERGNVFATLLAGGDTASGQMLAVTDGQRHKDIRTILTKAFSPRALNYVAERVRGNASRLVSEAVGKESCDFATEVAERIPISTICDLLGVPSGDHDILLGLTKSTLGSDRPGYDELEARLARNEILLYFGDLVERRRKDPQEDVISVLATAVVDGARLPEDTVVLNCYSLLLGGDETSRLSMIGAVQAFIDSPTEWRRLKNEEVTLETATEEILRWTSPAMHFGRRAVVKSVIREHVIEAGDIVTVWLSSANRDEEVFDRADEMDLARSPNKHITFGHGRHFCIGSYLGRAEVSAMIEALRSQVVNIERVGEPRPLHSNFFSGLRSLPVKLAAS